MFYVIKFIFFLPRIFFSTLKIPTGGYGRERGAVEVQCGDSRIDIRILRSRESFNLISDSLITRNYALTSLNPLLSAWLLFKVTLEKKFRPLSTDRVSLKTLETVYSISEIFFNYYIITY